MKTPTYAICAICGALRHHPGWFLLAQDSWRDRLKILRWNDLLARQEGIRCACGSAHVRELVAHWMATGNLDYPFASASTFENWINKCLDRDFGVAEPPLEISSDVVGELAVDRAALRRTLQENSGSLSSTLEALLRALDADHPASTEVELEIPDPVFA
jgi:hypothetical protein